MKIFGSFFSRLSDDFKLKELLPLKILFFTHISTLYVLYPYLTIHMRSLGINLEETAVISSVIPVVAIFIPPIAGLIGDKIGNYKMLLAILSSVGGVASLLFLLVPVGRVNVIFPNKAEVTVGCLSDGFNIDISQFPCEPLHPYGYDVEMSLESCGFACQWRENEDKNISNPLHKAVSYAVKIKNSAEGATEVFRYPLGSHDRLEEPVLTYDNSVKNFTNNLRYATAMRRISTTTLFFPTNGMYDFDCKMSYENSSEYSCEFGSNETSLIKMPQHKELAKYWSKISPFDDELAEEALPLSILGWSRILHKFNVKGLSKMKMNHNSLKMSSSEFMHPTCTNNFETEDNEISIEILFEEEDPNSGYVGTMVELEECVPKCLATVPRDQICSNLKEEIDINVKVTFWSYLAVRVLLATIGGMAAAMFEGAVIAILREHGGDYGLQKIYGILGGMISSPISGILIDYVSRNKEYKDFRPAIYLYAVLKTLSAFVMLTINLEFKAPAKSLMNDVMSVLKNVETIILFVVIFILGTAWGYIESFLFWLLQDLGASNSLMGITVTIGGIGGLPLLVLSGPIIERFGHANVLFVGFIFYSIRLLGYSLIYNPWMSLIFEALEGVTTSLTFTAAVTYAAKLSSISTDTSIQGMVGGLYHGVGKGAGSLAGGYMMKSIGTRPTYQVFSIVALITGCIYFLFNKFYVLKRRNARIEKENECNMKSKDIEACAKANIANGKELNEKLPLKNIKNNMNLYSDNNSQKYSLNNISGELQQNDKVSDSKMTIDPTQSILARDNTKIEGVENPAFNTNVNSGVKM